MIWVRVWRENTDSFSVCWQKATFSTCHNYVVWYASRPFLGKYRLPAQFCDFLRFFKIILGQIQFLSTKLGKYFQKITSNKTIIIFFIDNDCKSCSGDPNRLRFKAQIGDLTRHNSVISEKDVFLSRHIKWCLLIWSLDLTYFTKFATEFYLFLLES